jgi:translation initiation factor IF-3
MTKKQGSKHKAANLKEIKVRPQINKHDLDFKVNHIKKFLKDGNKVKLTMVFRGREIVYSSLAKKTFDKVCEELKELANIERMAKLEGRQMTMILSPK